MSYFADEAEMYRSAAALVDKVSSLSVTSRLCACALRRHAASTAFGQAPRRMATVKSLL
jgi:hypothetical protein